MLELPEVETVRAGLEQFVVPVVVDSVDVVDTRGLRPSGGLEDAALFETTLSGRQFTAVNRRGKYLWFILDDGTAMLAHLGMSGQFRVSTQHAPQHRHTRIVITLDDGRDLRFLDQRTFGGIDAYTYDGYDGVYGYPWYLGTDLNWWNTEAFEKYGLDPKKLPTTLDELYAQAITMAEKSHGTMPLISIAPALGDLAAQGVKVYKDGKFTFNTDQAVEIIQKYVELYAKKAMPPEVLQNNYLGNSKLFLQDKVAWTTGSASFPVDLKKSAPKLLPHVAMTTRIGVPPLFVQGICVSADSKNPNLALAFAQYVTNNANQVDFVKLAQGFLPGTKEANENTNSFTSVISDPQMKKAAEALAGEMKSAKIGEPMAYTDAMKAYVGQQISSAMRGDISAKDALDRAVKYCNDHVTK